MQMQYGSMKGRTGTTLILFLYVVCCIWKHEGKDRYSREKIQSWKLALHKASFYTGEIIPNQCDEEMVVMKVVTCVLKELKKMRLDVAQHPVGLDEAEQDFQNIALRYEEPIKIVGIWGMGGAGKTTLAKHLYNKKCSTFKRSAFLFDVGEAAFRGRLHDKQKKLLEDLNFNVGSANFDSIDEGKEILRSRLRSVPVLIVLDDVDHKDQLDALLPSKDSLGNGSLIIVTTRELRVLRACGISAVYKIRKLNPYYAEELFCWHSFGQPSPFIDFKELTNKFIDACCGLPLSLKVVGGLLHGESSKEYWESQLHKLCRILPEDIKSRLKISYDALDTEEKEMFLDVACFFIGRTSNEAIATWDGSEWSGLHGWQRLVNKCLVELDEYNDIRMHDHLRDLGREIANKQSPYRLWCKGQRIQIQQPQQQAIQIRGMADAFGDNCYQRNGNVVLNTTQGERILAPGSLGLKIYIGDGDFINEDCIELSRELVFFSCDRFAHKNFPSWFPLKKLRILNLCEPQKLEDLWECDADAPLQLRQLIIDMIRKGNGLKKISGLQTLRSLEALRMSFCTELKTLPSLAGLTSLKEIELRDCRKLEKLECPRSLETLRIYYCTELKTLPSLAGLTSLKEIELTRCDKLEKLEGLECLRSLEAVRIYLCRELKTLPGLAGLTSLKEIELRDCQKLENLEGLEWPRSLETLGIEHSRELKILPSLAGLTSLKKIELNGCHKLKKLEGLECLRSLETVGIHGCPELKTLPSLSGLTSLKKVVLNSCDKLEKLEGLECLRSLETVGIESCTNLKTLPSLAELTSLKKIRLRSCHKLEKLEGLECLRSLEALRVYLCRELKTLPSLAGLTSLEEFELRGCEKVEQVEGLQLLRSLKRLEVHMCSTRPWMLKLPEQSERLKSVVFVGNRVVVVEPSICELQKWGREEYRMWTTTAKRHGYGGAGRRAYERLSVGLPKVIKEAWLWRGREESIREAFSRLTQR